MTVADDGSESSTPAELRHELWLGDVARRVHRLSTGDGDR